MMTELNKLPRNPEPYWRDSVTFSDFPQLKEDLKVEVLVVGGGITGITTAYFLAKEGVKTAIIDAGKILHATTGHTTAKITAQHDVIYDEYIQHFGEENARLYYEANMEALTWIHNTVSTKQIECDFSFQDAYLYSTSEVDIQKLEKEVQAYKQLGIKGDLVTKPNLPFEVKAALVMEKQAQFHPLQYLKYLVDEFIRHGGVIFENTTALKVEEADHPIVTTNQGFHITCDHLVIASHFPFYDGMGFYFTRLYAERSYALAVKTKKPFIGGMYLSIDKPTRSLRSVKVHGENYLLVGGESHKTGQGIPTIQHYEALVAFTEEHYGIEKIAYRWSTQDLITLDKMPYIGPITSKKQKIYVATGFRKWGMTTGTAAGMILRDTILQRENPYIDLFHPARFKSDPSIKHLITQNVDVAKHLVKGKVEMVLRRADELQNDEGSVVAFQGRRAGAYRDESGTLHIVDTTCTHLGCEVEWNEGERTWDCPCHASRFSIDGDVIEGPAEQPLKKLNE